MEPSRYCKNIETRVEADLSEVIAKRLAGYVVGTETAGVQPDPEVPSEYKDPPSETPTCEQTHHVPDHDKEAVMTENRLEGKRPSSAAFREKEALFQGFQQSGVQNSSLGRLFKAVGLILLVVALSGSGYLFAQHAKGGPATKTSLPAGVLTARKLVICDARGLPRAQLHEQNGVVWFELCDAAGKTRASISLGADEEPKFCLFDKDHKIVKEWEWATEVTPKVENLTPEAVTSPRIENATTSQAIVAPTYIGSVTSNKYHYPDCKWGKQILPEKVLKFNSVKEPQDKGYIQCQACRPLLFDALESQ